MNGDNVEQDRVLENRAAVRVLLCMVATIAMLVFTIVSIVNGTIGNGTQWLWLGVLALWVLGHPTDEEVTATLRMKELRLRRKRDDK